MRKTQTGLGWQKIDEVQFLENVNHNGKYYNRDLEKKYRVNQEIKKTHCLTTHQFNLKRDSWFFQKVKGSEA